MTENNNIAAFEGCYVMQSDDIKAFADTLATLDYLILERGVATAFSTP